MADLAHTPPSIRPRSSAFRASPGEWWDPAGKFAPLHQLKPVRIGYIRDRAAAHWKPRPSVRPAVATTCHCSISAAAAACSASRWPGWAPAGNRRQCRRPRNIAVAAPACREAGTADRLPAGRRRGAGPDLGARFDIVLALEIVEHVADAPLFLKSCGRHWVKPGGLLFLSMLNRTAKAWALAIAGGEYILRWLPRGTHDWQQVPETCRKSVNGLSARRYRGAGDRRRGLQPAEPRLVAQQERPRRELHAVWH